MFQKMFGYFFLMLGHIRFFIRICIPNDIFFNDSFEPFDKNFIFISFQSFTCIKNISYFACSFFVVISNYLYQGFYLSSRLHHIEV